LIEAKKIHYDALNDALPQEYKISWEEHLAKYDGLKTNDKLNLLKKEKNLKKSEFTKIWKSKQINTLLQIKKIKKSEEIINVFKINMLLGIRRKIEKNTWNNFRNF
jgi:hypothetical protein